MAESKVVRFLDVDQIYPVGCIYMSVNSTNPSLLFGGTWEAINDRFLLASGTNYMPGSIGGESNVTLTTEQLPSHNHGSIDLTGTITVRKATNNGDMISGTTGIVSKANAPTTLSAGVNASSSSHNPHMLTINASHTHNSVGNGAAHNNMPPYLAVYVWKRTA